MKIPKEVKQAVKAAQILREQALREEEFEKRMFDRGMKLAQVRPKCWKALGALSTNHAHDFEGNCIVHNWSNEDAKGNWRKAK